MSSSEPSHATRALARSSWGYRLRSELEASARFRALAPLLRAQATSPLVADMAEESASDELRHARLCRELVAHFGGESGSELPVSPSRLAPPGIEGREGVLYEVVALCCVTETLSTALLAELVARAQDQVCRGAMHEILCDEVKHSRLGWALLAEEHARGVRDCVGRHLPQMLRDTLGRDFFDSPMQLEPRANELAGLGFLERPERQRIVRETLDHVIFPGLDRFGVDTVLGRRWLAGFDPEPG
ncbi:MAG: ferritin-like domain-containing protein [Pseudomonadota bacterium]